MNEPTVPSSGTAASQRSCSSRNLVTEPPGQNDMSSERLLALLVENVMDYGIFLLDPPGHIVSWNTGAERIEGYTAQEVLGQPVSMLYLPEDVDRGKPTQLLREAAEQGRAEDVGWRVRKDGSRFWSTVVVTALHHQVGTLIGFATVTRDLTVQKAEEETRERLLEENSAERRWLQAITAQSPAGIILVRRDDGPRIVANPRAEQLLGRHVSPDGDVARCMGDVVHPDGTALTTEEMPVIASLRGEMVAGRELLVCRPTGDGLPVLVSTAPICNERADIIGAVVTFQDITPMKELERLREEWTAVVAHDLRQPAAVITGYAELVRRAVEGDTARERVLQLLDHIESSSKSLNKMIGDLLDLTHIEARRLRIEPRPTDLVALVSKSAERLALVAQSHPIQVHVNGAIPVVNVDPMRIEQALANLLSNASKYSYPSSLIDVSVERQREEVEIAVSNWGDGIATEELPRLFGRFYRTGSALDEHVRGLGLGLYITKGLIEAHNGRIWVESVPRQRTTFHIRLPVPHEAVRRTEVAAG